ncbi:MAG: type 1 glutamine amidotransferase [Burkholderiaceae bacterium]
MTPPPTDTVSTAPRTLAIVVCVPGPRDRLGPIPDEFDEIEAGLASLRPRWRFVRLDPARDERPVDLGAFDAVVFSGSPSSVNDPDAWIGTLLEQVRGLHAKRVPMVGICFGHQLIAKALGGAVGPNPAGLIAGPVPVHWSDQAPWMQPPRTEVVLRAMHHDQVLRAPAEAEVIASAEHCPVAAFRVGGHVLGTQHHPEMPAAHLSAVLDLLGRQPGTAQRQTVIASARASLDRPTDGALVMGWLARFLEDGGGRGGA